MTAIPTKSCRAKRAEAALHRRITACMRLAISMAARFRRYGAPMNDLIQEASLSLMKAADTFDPDRGVRFSTYSVWWIKASIQDHVLRNWSMVRTGSTSSRKSLFFNPRRVQAKLEGRLTSSDLSLHAPQASDEDGREWIDALEDDGPQVAEVVEDRHDKAQLRACLLSALGTLNERERYIVAQRKLIEEPRTLESLGAEMGLSKERIRQLEAAAYAKLKRGLEQRSPEVQVLLA